MRLDRPCICRGSPLESPTNRGVCFASVSIDNAPFKGVLPLPLSALKSAAVLGNPANHGRASSLTFEQFKFGWTKNLREAEARHLYETYHVPASGAPLFQAAVAKRQSLRRPDEGQHRKPRPRTDPHHRRRE